MSTVIRIKCKCPDVGYLDLSLSGVQDFLRSKFTLDNQEKDKDICPEHGEEKEFFCANCQYCVCSKCKNGNDHYSHQIFPINEYAEKFKKFLNGIKLKFPDLDAFITHFDKIAKDFKTKIEEDFGATVKNIEEMIKNLQILKVEYAKIIKSRLEQGVSVLKIIKMLYCKFYLELQQKDTCNDIFILKYLSHIKYEFSDMTLRHNENSIAIINEITNRTQELSKAKESLLTIDFKYEPLSRVFVPTASLLGHKKPISCIIQLRNGQIVTGSSDFTIRIWKEINGQFAEIHQIKEFTGNVYSLSQLKDGRILSSARDSNTIRIWDKNKDKYICEVTLSEHKASVTCMVQLADERLVSGSRDCTVCIWDSNMKAFQCKQTLKEHTGGVFSLAELNGGRIASGGDDNKICIWEEKENEFKCTNILNGHTSRVKALCALNDGSLCSGGEDRTLRIWEEKEGQFTCVCSENAANGGLTSIIQMRDDRIVCSSTDKTIRIWIKDNQTKKLIKSESLKEHSHMVIGVIQLMDGRLASCGADNQVIIWKSGVMFD